MVEKGREFQALSVERLRTYKGFENTPDKEAEEIVATLIKISQLTFKYFNYVKERNQQK